MISFKARIGSETNNYCELMALMIARENGVFHIQIFGDSLLVIPWMKGEYNLWNFTLKTIIS
jgi:ribonuclease HI